MKSTQTGRNREEKLSKPVGLREGFLEEADLLWHLAAGEKPGF